MANKKKGYGTRHFSAEGEIEFTSLLYVPSQKPPTIREKKAAAERARREATAPTPGRHKAREVRARRAPLRRSGSPSGRAVQQGWSTFFCQVPPLLASVPRGDGPQLRLSWKHQSHIERAVSMPDQVEEQCVPRQEAQI